MQVTRYNTTILYIYSCKNTHYFPIKQTFSGKYAILKSIFNIQRRKTVLRSRRLNKKMANRSLRSLHFLLSSYRLATLTLMSCYRLATVFLEIKKCASHG